MASSRPISAIRGPELNPPQLPVGPAHRHLFAGSPPTAHVGRRHKERLRRRARLENLRAHHFGSPSCKPSAGSPIGRWMSLRSTASDTARSRPRCTAWCSGMPLPLSPRQRSAPAAFRTRQRFHGHRGGPAASTSMFRRSAPAAMPCRLMASTTSRRGSETGTAGAFRVRPHSAARQWRQSPPCAPRSA